MRVSCLAATLALSTALSPLSAAPAPVADLVKRVDIPFEQFTLPNGLRVVVHTDRKAPVVAVAVWYHIGSKDEPAGKTGFAHLFEHLMFGGSEHAPGSVLEQFDKLGATNLNGTTYFDRTNYFETVPTGALDRALYIESDRMGYLLGGLPQSQLDIQRGVVQNEKRRGDNQPFGLTEYAVVDNLFPDGHPYHHTTIGSMADLDAASMDDVRAWFRGHYGPNNAVMVLAGDIDLPTAKAKAARWFNEIPRGPAVSHPKVDVPALAAAKTVTLHDHVATTRITRQWAIPGEFDKDAVSLDLAASVLGGLASSRFDNALVRTQQVAVDVSASAEQFENVGIFTITADVKPGADPAVAGASLDAVVTKFLAEGPTPDELDRAKIREADGTIKGLESVSGKAYVLATGAVYANDPGFYKKELGEVAAATPAHIRDVARKWLSRPPLTIITAPGEREPYAEANPNAVRPATAAALPPSKVSADRASPPAVAGSSALAFPTIERTTLSNGIPLILARRASIPTVQVSLSFDAGFAADDKARLGTQSLMLAVLQQGTTSRNAQKIAEDSEALGAQIGAGATLDATSITLSALTPNLRASLDLLADVALRPAFAVPEVARLKAQRLAEIDAANKGPSEPARRAIAAAIYGPDHPYGRSASGLGSAEVVKTLTADDLRTTYAHWLRPDNVKIFVVGDTDLATIKPYLEACFGGWAAQSGPKPTKDFSIATPAPRPRIILINRPNAPQSYIVAGHILKATGRDDLVTLRAANEVLGGSFLSRINADLREAKSWSYGTRSGISGNLNQIAFTDVAEVQADKTGESIKAILADIHDFLGPKGTTPAEFERTINGDIRELPGRFETAGAVMGGVQDIVNFRRADDYFATLPGKYEAMTAAEIDAAARAQIDPAKLVFVVVGESAKVKPQLAGLGLAVEDR
jgi:predicted Zn-dependent peptidase